MVGTATTTVYTNEWARIAGRLRPTNYLLAVAMADLLLGAAVLLAEGDPTLAIESAVIGLVIGSALVILIWRRGSSTEINLGSEQVRSGRVLFSFSEITDLDLHSTSGNLYVVSGKQRVMLPLIWLSKSQIKVIERMARLLENPALDSERIAAVHEHLLDLLAD